MNRIKVTRENIGEQIVSYKFEDKEKPRFIGYIPIQTGPVKKNGVNGVQADDLIEAALDMLIEYQKGKFPCKQNAEAISLLRQAIEALNERTADREKRGVESLECV